MSIHQVFSPTGANGWRYPLVGGTRQRHFDGTRLEPRKLPENAQIPTSQVHASLGGLGPYKALFLASFPTLTEMIKPKFAI
jgi:hypothetical protein